MQETKRKLSNLTKEVCFYLSKTPSLRNISAQFMKTLEVLITQAECPFTYLDTETVSIPSLDVLLSNPPNSFLQACTVGLTLKVFGKKMLCVNLDSAAVHRLLNLQTCLQTCSLRHLHVALSRGPSFSLLLGPSASCEWCMVIISFFHRPLNVE